MKLIAHIKWCSVQEELHSAALGNIHCLLIKRSDRQESCFRDLNWFLTNQIGYVSRIVLKTFTLSQGNFHFMAFMFDIEVRKEERFYTRYDTRKPEQGILEPVKNEIA